MKAYLMFKDRDFALKYNPLKSGRSWSPKHDLKEDLSENERILMQDLELETLWNAMSGGDEFLLNVVVSATLQNLTKPEEILYRQAILKDCQINQDIVREIYGLAVESIEDEKKETYGLFHDYPDNILHRSVKVMQNFAGTLGRLKKLADDHAGNFESDGFTTFFDMIKLQLNDEYFQTIQYHLKELEFKGGLLVSAELGNGNTGVDMVLRKPNVVNQNWLERLFTRKPPSFTLTISTRDEAGMNALNELENKGLNLAANALAQSVDHILSFWKMLRAELGFYIGCLNLQEKLDQLGEPIAFPEPLSVGERKFSFHEMYDICLSLTKGEKVIGNDADTQGKDIVIITGANQGGKSTFLRSVGLTLLMMQCGMFVPAESFTSNVCTALFTHYKREEDASMSSGKLDEELSRMNDIVEQVVPNAVVFFNESFAATNEREGSEIARQVVEALLDRHIQVFFVTHFYEFAHGFYCREMKNALYLRAQRQENGIRTFKLVEGEPLQTSFGEDLYNHIFEEEITA